MNGPELLKQHVGKLSSRMGTFYPGERVVYRGRDLLHELNDMDWLALYLYGITGKTFGQAEMKLLQAIWTYTSYPDVRLWNNRIAALAGSTRSTGTLGLAAALAVSEAEIYGGGVFRRAVVFLERSLRQMASGSDLETCVREEFAAHRSIGGYGRPLVNGDERIVPLLELAKRLGLNEGPHLKLAFEVEDFLLRGRWRMKMNYAALIAALGKDLGLSVDELCLFIFPLFLAGMPPGYIEARQRPEGTLYPIPCPDVTYDGQAKRPWHK
ncbi:citryl-CoA lyase [Methylomonas sp. HYX-M1]|uniref:citryl-CoA lyase n=1 Tax=Methylomonas sp. HYX-M1 TaxID=3139307 RepID=UPI00345B64E9